MSIYLFAGNAALEKKKKILFRKFIHVDTIIIASVIQRLTGNEVTNTLKGETFADYKVFNINFFNRNFYILLTQTFMDDGLQKPF